MIENHHNLVVYSCALLGMALAVIGACDRPASGGSGEEGGGKVTEQSGASPEGGVEPDECVVAVDTAEQTVEIAGESLEDYELDSLRDLLGKPSRAETRESKARFEEYGGGDRPSTSHRIDVIEQYYVYDALGLVFLGSKGKLFDARAEPVFMFVFFDNALEFDGTEPPALVPRQKGVCALEINGERVEADERAVGEGVGADSGPVEAYGATFTVSTTASDVDGLYSVDAVPEIRMHLDGPEGQRPAFVRIRAPGYSPGSD